MMSKRIGYLTVAFVACIARSIWASSIPIPTRGPQEQYALVVGVDSSSAKVTPHLQHIVDLLSSEYGYRRANILDVYNEKATLDGLHAAVGQISSRIGPADSLFVIVVLPTARGAEDVVAVPFGADPAKPWTVLSTNDFAGWFAKIRAGQIAAVFPACVGRTKASVYAFEELRYTRSSMGTMQIATVCDETGGAMAAAVELIENELAGPAGRLDVRATIILAASKLGHVVSIADIGELRPFFLTREGNKLQPLLDTVQRGTNAKDRVGAIHDIVAAIKAEPSDRRTVLVRQSEPTLTNAIGDASRDVRLAAIWAAGEIGLDAVAPRLADQFLHADQDEKRTIITALNNLQASEAVDVIRRALEDPSPAVRVATLRAGATLHDNAVETKIVTLATSDPEPEVRVAVLQVISGMSLPEAKKIEVIERALADPTPAVRRQAVATWADLGQSAATQPLLSMLEKDPDPDVRQTVAYAIGRGPVDAAQHDSVVTHLIEAQSSKGQSSRVREATAWSLGRLGGDRAEAALIRIVANHATDSSVRAAAAESLGLLKSKAAVPALIDALGSRTASLRRTAAEALGKIGDERALDPLLGALSDVDSQVRTAASTALNAINPKAGSLNILLTNLRDEKSPSVRMEAAQKLGAFETPAVTQQLINRLSDSDPQVRSAVIASLSKFQGEASRDEIRAALVNTDLRVQEGAVIVAGLQGLTDQRGRISSIIANSQNPGSLRAEAVRAAPKLGAEAAVVFNAAHDPDPLVREASVDALRSMSSDRSVEELKRLSNDDSPAIREKAILALRSYSAMRRKD